MNLQLLGAAFIVVWAPVFLYVTYFHEDEDAKRKTTDSPSGTTGEKDA